MEDKDLFMPVLDNGEEILKTYRPNKLRAWFTSILSMVFIFFCFVVTFISLLINSINDLAASMAVFLILIPYVAIISIFIKLWLNKTVYAVTTKRIIIRTGYIGVDYKSLDYTMLGALTVNVSWIDKLLHKNTGSIAFGSMASPMTNQAVAKFTFSFIKDPYNTYKEIKQIIDAHKDK